MDDLEQDTPSNSETIAATKAQIAKHEKAISDMSFENCVTCDFKYKVTDEVAVWNPSKKCWEANRTIEYCGASEKIWQMENIHQGGQKPTQNSKPERGIKSRNATEFEGKDAHTTIRKAKNLKTKGEKISHILTWETIEVLPQDSPKKTKALKLPLIFVQGSCENSSVLKGDPAPYLSWFAKEKIPNGSTIRVSCITNNHRTGVLGQVTLDNFVKDLKQIHPNYTFIADYENSNFENDLSKPQSYEVILEVEK